MDVRENEPLKPKTTMRIGGVARYFAELAVKDDVEAAFAFAQEKNIPLIPLGSGANTIFADGTINALVVRIAYAQVNAEGDVIRVGAGKNLPMLINELAKEGKDLSPLTGIPGTVGGAIFGNAGQGPQGVWSDHFIEQVECHADGLWQILSKEQCDFGYRDSVFKKMRAQLIWEATLRIPENKPENITKEIESLLKKRIETQPHLKTAGSCFKAKDGTPAWQLIDAAGKRGYKVGDVEVADKHANFLLNKGQATFVDAVKIVEDLKSSVGNLDVEMRFVDENGNIIFA